MAYACKLKCCCLAWCEKQVKWNFNQFQNFIHWRFFFLQQKTGRVRVCRRKVKRRTISSSMHHRKRQSERFAYSRFVWYCIISFLIEGYLTGQCYVDQILNPHFVPFIHRDTHFSNIMQDVARAFGIPTTATDWNITLPFKIAWFKPSPIEHLWDELERCLMSLQLAIRNLQELSDAVLKEWNYIPLYKIRRIIASMIKRHQAGIDVQGGHTRYWCRL